MPQLAACVEMVRADPVGRGELPHGDYQRRDAAAERHRRRAAAPLPAGGGAGRS